MKSITFDTRYLKEAHLFYKEYCHKDNTILYESAEIIDKSGVQSLIGVSAALKITCEDLKVKAQALNQNGKALLRIIARALNAETDENSLTIAYSRPQHELDEETRLKADNPF